ncbi:protein NONRESPONDING TO OXYLIPINS 2, mitochondrial-like [Lotus japonicus]|uniref:protein NONRESPONDING TO OXYLIPINS 2, mitochondrial-like n=1 Tax=Lotus japonicus TaxID=34305 RepID=UPI00258975A3|nr:protein NONRESPONDING TO OXYLIPINS 2, mitochondrial-like [Lotus japonicus]
MASMFCNSALRVASRSLTNRFRTFVQKSLIPSLFSSPSSAGITHASRILSEMGSVESTMPLHSAIANARLTSNMACYSTCWSMLSQGTFSYIIAMKEKKRWKIELCSGQLVRETKT